MALYSVTTGNASAALDLDQYLNLLTGVMTDQPVTIANRIRATNTGASSTAGFMGGVVGGAPASGTFALGDYVVDQNGPIWTCVGAGTPGTWRATPTQIATTKLGASAASVTFSSVPSVFSHLLLAVLTRGDAVATDLNLNVRLNGDASSKYQYTATEFTPGLGSADFYSQTAVQIGKAPAASATSKMYSTTLALISSPQVAGTVFTSVVSMSFRAAGTTSGSNKLGIYGGTYQSAANITSVTVLPGSGNLVSSSVVSLYGLM